MLHVCDAHYQLKLAMQSHGTLQHVACLLWWMWLYAEQGPDPTTSCTLCMDTCLHERNKHYGQNQHTEQNTYNFTKCFTKHGSQDVEVLVHMARRRCLDEKAAVRKAGVQLLEALLLLRAKGLGGADVELPNEQDIRALEAATADALVCVCFRLSE